jgi:short-subunit dehydrogenase
VTTACIIGASAGLGLALARELASGRHDLVLVARDARDLDAIADDLRIRYSIRIQTSAVDIREVDPDEFVKSCCALSGYIDHLLVVAGNTNAHDAPGLPDNEVVSILEANLVAPIRMINAFIPHLLSRPSASITGAGSIASIRARRNNLHYAAAKTGVEFYFHGLRHAFSGNNCRVQFYRLGYLETQMTFGQRLMLPAARPERVAADIVAKLGIDTVGAYLPRWWRLPAMLLQWLPWAIYRRLDF